MGKFKNWINSFFQKKDKPFRTPKMTLFDFFMYLFDLHHEYRSMAGYLRENWKICDDLNKYPSKKIMKRYNLTHNSSNMFAWWLMEQYFEGNLVIKENKESNG